MPTSVEIVEMDTLGTHTLVAGLFEATKLTVLDLNDASLLALLLSPKRVPLPLRNGDVLCCMLAMHAAQKPTF
jgi:hypothetical protein